MKIAIDGVSPPRILEAEDLKSLSVVPEKKALKDASMIEGAILAIGGNLENGDVAWIPRAWLRAIDDYGWRKDFDAMIEYARSKGWVNTQLDLVRAHVERPFDPGPRC